MQERSALASASSPTPRAARVGSSSTSRSRHCAAFVIAAQSPRTGDGAGLLLPLPRALLPSPWCGLAMVFLRDEGAREPIERACAAEGIEVFGWRPVPVVPEALGGTAQASAPRIEQLVLRRPQGASLEEAERRAFRARKRAERAPGAYICSLSFRTVTYKALCAAGELGAFYPDLLDPVVAVPFAIFHQRFSTNTTPSWERSQPFRLSCHNGEINTIDGNRDWMRARGARLGSEDDGLLVPVLDESGSDSAMLDNALEVLVRARRDVRHAATMLVPEAWQENPELDEDVRAFYRYQACLLEPWDGPAGIVFTDGGVVGARLDRNGLRPLRVAVCEDGLVVCASEAGTVDLAGSGRVRRARLGPGEMIAVDPARAGVETDAEIKRRLAARRPYRRWLRRHLVQVETGAPVAPPARDLTTRQVAAGYTREELALVVRPAAGSGHEPVSSMGDDTALPPLAGRARPLFSYFRQRFAQVTNPPIDHLRERSVMSLRTLLGARAPLLTERPEAVRLLELDTFFLFPSSLRRIELRPLDATFGEGESLAAACTRLAEDAVEAVRTDASLLLLSDSASGPVRAPVPALLAVGAVHRRLLEAGLRSRGSLLVESDEPRESHHFACLLGYGADAVCPKLALETVAALSAADRLGGDHPSSEEAQRRFQKAIEQGVLEIMAKMGISDVASYRGAQLFESIGLARSVVERCFAGTPCLLGGTGFVELERDVLARHAAAHAERPQLENPGYVKFRKGGERHATSPMSSRHSTRRPPRMRCARRSAGAAGWHTSASRRS